MNAQSGRKSRRKATGRGTADKRLAALDAIPDSELHPFCREALRKTIVKTRHCLYCGVESYEYYCPVCRRLLFGPQEGGDPTWSEKPRVACSARVSSAAAHSQSHIMY